MFAQPIDQEANWPSLPWPRSIRTNASLLHAFAAVGWAMRPKEAKCRVVPGNGDKRFFFGGLMTNKKVVLVLVEGSLEVKLPTIWTDEKQRWEESERREE